MIKLIRNFYNMELRKDYLLNRWSMISESRGKRPNDFASPKTKSTKECIFCKGHESETPQEISRVEENGEWAIRVIPNKFAATDPKADPLIQTHNQYYTFSYNHGSHELVVETPFHGKKFGDLSQESIKKVLKVYAERISVLQKDNADKYVCVFKNEGKEAGASINHAHSQIIAVSFMPPELSEKLEVIKKYSFCPYCDIISKEKDSYRRCFDNFSFISFTPYAPRFNYEIWLFPKRHINSFFDFNDQDYSDLASMLKTITHKLESEGFDFDIAYYYSPGKEDLHFHIEIMPRVTVWAGFEMGFGTDIITVSPEDAAKFYRGE